MTKRPPAPIPASVKAGPLDYVVTTDAGELGKACRDQGSNLFGSCDHPSLKIVVDPEQAAGQARESLLHETLHALVTLTGLGDEWGERKEEAFCRRFSPALLGLLRDNRGLVDYLLEET